MARWVPLRNPQKSGALFFKFIVFIVVLVVWSAVGTDGAAAAERPASRAAKILADTTDTCDPIEGYRISDGRDYRGYVNVTASGFTCQKWTSQTPWTHDTEIDAAAGIGDHNYCRNPNGQTGPGCYTTNPSMRYELCDVGEPCTYPSVDLSITYTPASGSSLVAASTNNYVTVTCFPRPCTMYYTLGESTPTATTGTLYSKAIVLSTNTTITTLAVFSDGSTTYAQARYVVQEAPTVPPSIAFSPSTAHVYTSPVAVSITGLLSDDEVLIYTNDDMVPFTYNGTFWVSSTTLLTAVLNGVPTMHATYTVDYTPPAVVVYPDSGNFTAGVRMLVQESVSSTFFTSINGSAYQLLSGELMRTITTPGTHNVTVKAVYLGGASAVATRVYVVTAATAPTISPNPSVIHYRPINVTCTDPTGRLLSLTSQSLVGDSTAATVSTYLYLTSPGFYSVTCSYVDSLDSTHLSSAVVQLEPQALPSPTFSPVCGEYFSAVPLSLAFALRVPNYSTTYATSRLDVETSITDNALVDFVVKETDVAYTYGVRFPNGISGTASFTFSARAFSTDPMESSSPTATCTYYVVQGGQQTTPMFVAQPTCYTWDAAGDVIIDDTCATQVTQQVADCLYFYTTDNITVRTLGPYVGLYVNGLDSSLVATYETRLATCLNSSAVDVEDVRDEKSGLIQLATSWKIADGADINADASNQSTVTGNPFLVEVRGINMDKGVYKLVPSESSCRTIGVDAMLTGQSASAQDELATMEYLPLLFVVDTPGVYKLCVEMDSTVVYAVPSTSNLTVAPQAWPTVVLSSPCGGVVESAQSTKTLSVTTVTTPSFTFPDYTYSLYYGSAWRGAAVQSSGSAVTLPAVNLANPYDVIAATPGATAGASATCVYYAVSEITSAVSYTFLKLNETAGNTTDDKTVVVYLTGTFKAAERISVTILDSAAVELASFLATTSDGLNYTRALPDRAVPLVGGSATAPYTVQVTLDGQRVTANATTLALSPLALSMYACSTCTSGFCHADTCVCIGSTNLSAYPCNNTSGGGDDKEDTTTGSTRLIYLLCYFALLVIIGLGIRFLITLGDRRSAKADGVTIEGDENVSTGPGGADATAAAAAAGTDAATTSAAPAPPLSPSVHSLDAPEERDATASRPP